MLVAALRSTVILLALAVALGLVGIGLGWYLRRQEPTELPGPARARAALAVLGLAGAGLTTVAPNPCDIETAYHCARVTADPARPSGRTLLLNSAQHSYVDLADPKHLEYAYTKWIGAVADVAAPAGQRLDALHLGGGGFTVPRYLTATRPGTDNLVFEIDGGLVDLDRAGAGRTRRGRTCGRWWATPGCWLPASRPTAVDLVVGDAFGHLVVPWHLATREMAADVRRVTRPGGVYVQNVIDYPPLRFIRAELATVAAEFRHVALIAPPEALAEEQGSNFLIVGSDAPLPLDAVRRPAGRGGPQGQPAVRCGADGLRRRGDGVDRRLRPGGPTAGHRLIG